jgi:hypothetical protein
MDGRSCSIGSSGMIDVSGVSGSEFWEASVTVWSVLYAKCVAKLECLECATIGLTERYKKT